MLLDRSAGLLHTGTLLNFYRCRKNGRRVAYDRDCGLWLSRVQGNSVCCCWRRAILHKRGGELSPSVRCSRGKIGSNRRSRPKKDIVGMFDGLFFVDQNSQTSVLITRFTEGHVDQEAW